MTGRIAAALLLIAAFRVPALGMPKAGLSLVSTARHPTQASDERSQRVWRRLERRMRRFERRFDRLAAPRSRAATRAAIASG
ncbi:MAG: hypothetical protein HY858_16810 [Candidatus Solibacter usitatus]|nr:hypothetical protein [Candidatus Solibacter usitatus]